MSHRHIISIQRNEIAVLKRSGVLQKDIAKFLGKTPSAISQEITRNKDVNGKYKAGVAKLKAKERRLAANARFRKLVNNPWLVNYIIRKLKLYWSPEQIAGRLRLDYPKDKKRRIGKDAIYEFIYSERKDLVKYLRCKKGNIAGDVVLEYVKKRESKPKRKELMLDLLSLRIEAELGIGREIP